MITGLELCINIMTECPIKCGRSDETVDMKLLRAEHYF